MADDKKQPQGLQFQINETTAQGLYANLAIVSNMDSEFILDFAQMLPGNNNNAKICSRIIMTPEHAKRLLSALSDNVEKYESQFGAIDFKQAKPSGTLNITDLMGGNGSRS